MRSSEIDGMDDEGNKDIDPILPAWRER